MRHLAIAIAAFALLGIAVAFRPARPSSSSRPAPVASDATPDEVASHHDESLRRHREMKAQMQIERDPAVRAGLDRRIAELDRVLEIEGLELKRAAAVRSGDGEKAAAIDRLLAEKRTSRVPGR